MKIHDPIWHTTFQYTQDALKTEDTRIHRNTISNE